MRIQEHKPVRREDMVHFGCQNELSQTNQDVSQIPQRTFQKTQKQVPFLGWSYKGEGRSSNFKGRLSFSFAFPL